MKLSYDPKPGMLVRCVDDDFDVVARYVVPHLPVRGIVYTVRSARSDDGVVAVHLVEIENPKAGVGGVYGAANGVYYGEPRFLAERFVPVDPRALDVFRKEEIDA